MYYHLPDMSHILYFTIEKQWPFSNKRNITGHDVPITISWNKSEYVFFINFIESQETKK